MFNLLVVEEIYRTVRYLLKPLPFSFLTSYFYIAIRLLTGVPAQRRAQRRLVTIPWEHNPTAESRRSHKQTLFHFR